MSHPIGLSSLAELAAATARAERAEAAIERVLQVIDRAEECGANWASTSLLRAAIAALDSTDPEPAPKEQANG